MNLKEAFRRNLNVPNVLTVVRLLLVPVYAAVFARGHKHAALIVFLLASLTDLLDGRIARKFNLITNFGKLVDPFADKLMVLTVMFSMTLGNSAVPGVLPLSAVIILLLKELVMIVGGLVMLRKGIVVYSSMIGKVAHCVFIAGLVLSFFHDWFVEKCVGWALTPDLLLVWVAVCFTLCALVFYVTQAINSIREKDAP